MMSISIVDSTQRRDHDRSEIVRRPDAIDRRNQGQREHGAEPRSLRRRRVAAVKRDHHAGEQEHERQHARQERELVPHRQVVRPQDFRGHARFFLEQLRLTVFAPKLPGRVGGEQCDQEQGRSDRGEKQAAQRLFGRDRIQDHRDRGRQQDAERAASRDDAGREPGGITALAHFRDAG